MPELALDPTAIEVKKHRVRIEIGNRKRDAPWKRELFDSHRLSRVSSHADLADQASSATLLYKKTTRPPIGVVKKITSLRTNSANLISF
jgi:hypothetical protein